MVLKCCKIAEVTIQSNWDHFYMHQKANLSHEFELPLHKAKFVLNCKELVGYFIGDCHTVIFHWQFYEPYSNL